MNTKAPTSTVGAFVVGRTIRDRVVRQRVAGTLQAVDVQKDRKLDDLANLLCEYLGTLQDIVQVTMPDDVDGYMREIYRRAGLQPLIA